MALGEFTSRLTSEAEDSRLEGAIGFSKTKRDYAYEFNVDVYSRNQIMQDHLYQLSWSQVRSQHPPF